MEKLSHSQEDYLEEIYNQVLKKGYANVTEIASALNVKKGSVTGALCSLAEKKLINYAPYSKITITDEGEKFAKNILQKHESLSEFFMYVLNLTKEEASEHACKMEHIVSEKFFNNFGKFSLFIRKYAIENPGFVEEFQQFMQ